MRRAVRRGGRRRGEEGSEERTRRAARSEAERRVASSLCSCTIRTFYTNSSLRSSHFSQRATHAEIVSLVDCCTTAKDEYEVKKLCGAIDPTYAHLRDSLQAAVTCRDCDKIDESIALLQV